MRPPAAGSANAAACASAPRRCAALSAATNSLVPAGPYTVSGVSAPSSQPWSHNSSSPAVFSGNRLARNSARGCRTGTAACRRPSATPRPASNNARSAPRPAIRAGPRRSGFSNVPPLPMTTIESRSSATFSSGATAPAARSKCFDRNAMPQMPASSTSITTSSAARVSVFTRTPPSCCRRPRCGPRRGSAPRGRAPCARGRGPCARGRRSSRGANRRPRPDG